MDTEDGVVDDNGEGEEVEKIGEVVPDVCVAVFTVTLRVKAVGLGHAPRFVVAADEVYAGWVPQFEEGQEGDGFDAE